MISIPRKLLCLDWDKRSLRVVSARCGRGSMKLGEAHAVRLPAGVDANEPQSLGPFIAQTLERFRLGKRPAVVDVPRERAVINRLKVPPLPAGELPAAVRAFAMRELPFPIEEAEIDYVVMSRDEKGVPNEVLVAAVRQDAIAQIRATCAAAGLHLVHLGLRPSANLRSVAKLPEYVGQRILFVDIGPGMTEIDVFREGTLAFSRAATVAVPFSFGELVTEDSRVSSKAELAELEQASAVESEVVSELLVEMTRTLQAYRAAEANSVIDQIVIAGGTGIEHALLDAADERFGLPVNLFDPTRVLGVAESESVKLRAFSAPLGLAWSLSRPELLDVDFLHPKRPVPPRATLQRRARVAGLALAGALVVVAGYVYSDRVRLNRELAALQRANDALRSQAGAVVLLDVRTTEADEWRAYADAGVWLDPLLDISQHLVDPGKQSLVSNLSADLRRGTISLQLNCGEEQAAAFVSQLESTEADGKPLYRAQRGKWQATSVVDPRFLGREDVRIELLRAAAIESARKADEKKREARLKEYGAWKGGGP